jgi:hypothetical protein
MRAPVLPNTPELSLLTELSTGRQYRRTVALFPGAFRPPHLAHIDTVEYLCSHTAIDEVVIIISARLRAIPDTGNALTPATSKHIWQLILADPRYRKARIEMASHTAVAHALAYFKHMSNQDRIVFCQGEADHRAGDSRFHKIAQRSAESGVNACLFVSPTAGHSIRSRDLRQSLTNRPAAEHLFAAAYPEHLPMHTRLQILDLCEQQQVNYADAISANIGRFLKSSGYRHIHQISIAGCDAQNPTFRVELGNATSLFAKSSADHVQGTHYKPASRIAIEKRSLSRLRGICDAGMEVPSVILYDKQNRMLIVNDVGVRKKLLEHQLTSGIVSRGSIAGVARFIRQCHQAHSTKAIRGAPNADRRYWLHMLQAISVNHPVLSSKDNLKPVLDHVYQQGVNCSVQCLMLLNATPAHFYVADDNRVAKVNLEHCCNYGDSAYDLGGLYAHILFQAELNGTGKEASRALAVHDHVWEDIIRYNPDMNSRLLLYTGLHLVQLIAARRHNINADTVSSIEMLGMAMLLHTPCSAASFSMMLATAYYRYESLKISRDQRPALS